jgi:hypothetical protein
VEVPLVEVGLPRIGVRVELNECERAVGAGEGAQLGERDRVISPHDQREDPRPDERRESLLDAAVRSLRVARRDREVAVVGDRHPVEHVEPKSGVVRTQERRGGTDRLGPKARSGAEARRRIERDPDDDRVEVGEVRHVRDAHKRADAREARDHLRVQRPEGRAGHRGTIRHRTLDRRSNRM